MVFSARRNRDNALRNTIECVVSIALPNEVHCKFTAILLPYFFNNFFIFSQWPLIFDLTKFNTSLHRFLYPTKVFKKCWILFNSVTRQYKGRIQNFKWGCNFNLGGVFPPIPMVGSYGPAPYSSDLNIGSRVLVFQRL